MEAARSSETLVSGHHHTVLHGATSHWTTASQLHVAHRQQLTSGPILRAACSQAQADPNEVWSGLYTALHATVVLTLSSCNWSHIASEVNVNRWSRYRRVFLPGVSKCTVSADYNICEKRDWGSNGDGHGPPKRRYPTISVYKHHKPEDRGFSLWDVTIK